MNAIVIRDGSGALVAFGPDNGMYQPVTPAGCTLTNEKSYDAVKVEATGLFVQPVDPFQDLKERVAGLEAKADTATLEVVK